MGYFFSLTRYIVLQKPKTEKPVYYKEGELKGNALWLKTYIENKTKKEELTFEGMVTKIDSKTPDLSKALFFVLIPFLALPLYLIGRKKYKFYAQHLFHATHLFTFYLAFSVLWIGFYILFISLFKIKVNSGIALIPVNVIFLFYAFFSIKKVYGGRWYETFGGTLFFLLTAVIAVMYYAQFITYFSAIIA